MMHEKYDAEKGKGCEKDIDKIKSVLKSMQSVIVIQTIDFILAGLATRAEKRHPG